ncbi:MAG: histidine phosphatase family protein [Actinobacteria bacterium]|nr:histidine phosphatase family protein [Actinomycetota bacterium]
MPTKLLIVRHGQSVWNALGRWQGQADPPLSSEGESQALEAAERLSGFKIDRVFSSDLQRARRTAEIIAEALGGAAVVTDPGLREVDVGQWSGLTRDEIERRWPGMLAARAQGRLSTPPGGETPTDLTARVRRAVNDIAAILEETAGQAAASEPQTAVLVSHRGPISTLERSVGLKPARAGHLSGHWFEITAGDRLRHIAAAHLLDGPAETGSLETL